MCTHIAIEMVGPQHRVLCTIVLNIGYSIGLVALAGIVYIVRDWRYLSLAVSVPLLLLYSCFFVLPESPRWLIATGNFKKAAKIMKTMAKFNGKTIPDDYEQVLRQKLQRPIQQQVTSPVIDEDEPTFATIGMLDLFKSPNMRAKTLIITFIWFSNTCVYVGLSYYAPALGIVWTNLYCLHNIICICFRRWWDLELFPGRSCGTSNVYFSVAWIALYWSKMDFVFIDDNRWSGLSGNVSGAA